MSEAVYAGFRSLLRDIPGLAEAELFLVIYVALKADRDRDNWVLLGYRERARLFPGVSHERLMRLGVVEAKEYDRVRGYAREYRLSVRALEAYTRASFAAVPWDPVVDAFTGEPVVDAAEAAPTETGVFPCGDMRAEIGLGLALYGDLPDDAPDSVRREHLDASAAVAYGEVCARALPRPEGVSVEGYLQATPFALDPPAVRLSGTDGALPGLGARLEAALAPWSEVPGVDYRGFPRLSLRLLRRELEAAGEPTTAADRLMAQDPSDLARDCGMDTYEWERALKLIEDGHTLYRSAEAARVGGGPRAGDPKPGIPEAVMTRPSPGFTPSPDARYERFVELVMPLYDAVKRARRRVVEALGDGAYLTNAAGEPLLVAKLHRNKAGRRALAHLAAGRRDVLFRALLDLQGEHGYRVVAVGREGVWAAGELPEAALAEAHRRAGLPALTADEREALRNEEQCPR